MSEPLAGRRVLVTGAATGIGAAAVEVLSDAGAAVVATFHTTPPSDRSLAHWLPCDVRDPADVDTMVEDAAAHLGGLDVLVHAAGLWQAGIPGHLGAEDISGLVAINVAATIYTNQAAHRAMLGSGGGRIINFGSAEAVMGSPISAMYAATKGAVHAWTRSAAQAWAAQNITVNAVAPAVQTPGAERLRDFLGPEGAAFVDQQMQSRIPIGGRLGDPVRDLGPALVFLAGEGSGFITGQLIPVDGGLLMVGS